MMEIYSIGVTIEFFLITSMALDLFFLLNPIYPNGV